MAIGASVGGLLADRFGRRQVFALTLLVYGLATGASALVGGLAALLVLRFFVGLGLGAELPVASTYVSEFAPARIRGRLIVILEAFWAVGWTAAALIGYLVIPASENGWRWAFALGAIPAAYALVVRWGLPESARWLERRGRHAEAEAVVRAFEESAGRRRRRRRMPRPRRSRRAAASSAAQPPRGARGPRSSGCARRASGWCGSASTSRTTARSSGSRRSSSRRATTSCAPSASRSIITLAQLPGYAVAAWLIEVWGRRLTLSVFLVGLRRRRGLLRHRREPRPPSSPPAWRCRSSTSARGARSTPSRPRCIRRRCARRARAGPRASGASRRSSRRSRCRCCSALGGAPLLFVVFAVFFVVAAAAAWGLVDRRGLALDDR